MDSIEGVGQDNSLPETNRSLSVRERVMRGERIRDIYLEGKAKGLFAEEPERLTEEEERILDHIWATIDEPWEDDDEPIVPAAIIPPYDESEETEETEESETGS